MDRNSIATKLRNLRGVKTMAEVAKAIGVSKSAMGMYETGRRVPRDDVKKRIAEYYNCPVADLFF